jgi:DNA-directed RNA polymerase specialized sigma24 family protein
VILLRHRDGLSFRAAGQALGMSAGAVTQLWRRAIQRLTEELGGLDAP